MSTSLAMKRILGNEKKNRKDTHVMIENEFLDIIKQQNLNISDFMNVQIEKGLSEKGYLKN